MCGFIFIEYVTSVIIYWNAPKFPDFISSCLLGTFGMFSSVFQHFLTSWHRNMFKNLLIALDHFCAYWYIINDIDTSYQHVYIYVYVESSIRMLLIPIQNPKNLSGSGKGEENKTKWDLQFGLGRDAVHRSVCLPFIGQNWDACKEGLGNNTFL